MELNNVSFSKYSWTLIRVPTGIHILFIILKAEFQLPCTISLPYPHFSSVIHIKIRFNLTCLVSSNRSCEKTTTQNSVRWLWMGLPLEHSLAAGSNYVKLVIKKERKKRKKRKRKKSLLCLHASRKNQSLWAMGTLQDLQQLNMSQVSQCVFRCWIWAPQAPAGRCSRCVSAGIQGPWSCPIWVPHQSLRHPVHPIYCWCCYLPPTRRISLNS